MNTNKALAMLAPAPAPEFQQERARKSYDALLAAAEKLFARTSYDDIGTPDIAAAAGMAVGTFYRYFPDKHAIYMTVARRQLAAAYAATIAKLTPELFVGRGRADTIAATVAILFEHVQREPSLWASFIEMSLRDREVGELRRSYDRLSCERLTELIAAICPREVVPDPAAMAHVLYGAAMECALAVGEQRGKSMVSVERATASLVLVLERALFP